MVAIKEFVTIYDNNLTINGNLSDFYRYANSRFVMRLVRYGTIPVSIQLTSLVRLIYCSRLFQTTTLLMMVLFAPVL
jgi:hypothetical protein